MLDYRPHVCFKTLFGGTVGVAPEARLETRGQAVAEALVEIYRDIGLPVIALGKLASGDWGFTVVVDADKVGFQVSGSNEFLVRTRIPRRLFGLLRPSHSDQTSHIQILTRLNERLQTDPRFVDVRWVFEHETGTDAPGAPEPFNWRAPPTKTSKDPFRLHAHFKTTIPDDMIESDDGEIIQFPGKAVSEAISEMLRGAGYVVSDLDNQMERGWEFIAELDRRTVWLLICEMDEFLLQTGAMDATRDFHAELLMKLNEAIRMDARFTQLRWVNSDEIDTDAPGAATPST
jgi:hypothetical protein